LNGLSFAFNSGRIVDGIKWAKGFVIVARNIKEFKEGATLALKLKAIKKPRLTRLCMKNIDSILSYFKRRIPARPNRPKPKRAIVVGSETE
tara:strand:+ start:1563 stop:1835 length:273 start_codon:yes stop_codon:yes gene_type:complete